MTAVVRDPDATGYRAWSPLVTIAGKTGTAQTHLPDRPHGWFVGFCPIEQPRVAMAILAEHGGSGGDLPAELAKAICEFVSAPETL
jgi:cell division protein FtsI/penicillin-binding protein 2